jgi:uncharacterized protein
MKPAKKLTSLLIKPSGPDCNLNCDYCFYLEKEDLFSSTKKHRMTEETLRQLYKRIGAESAEYLSITWQGGEPSLMGFPFYKKASELQRKHAPHIMIDYGFQTNGILINKYWGEFFLENNYLVGLSIEGPEHIHDKYRMNAGGKGTFEIVHTNAKLLLEMGVKVNAMSCVNNYSVHYPDEIYNFNKELGLNFMQFIPILEPDKTNPAQAAAYSVPADEYGIFLCRIFDLWMNDFVDGMPATSVRNFESVFFNYAGFESPECTHRNECGSYLVIEHNGNAYPCDFFVENELLLGSIINDSLTKMLNSEKQYRFGAVKMNRKPECAQCRWLSKCYGGCIKDRVKNPADRHHLYFCESYKMFYEHADERLTALAEKWKAENLR